MIRRCYGDTRHAKGCRPGRPLCRWMRRVSVKHRVCRCTAAHYPHRAGWCARFGGMPAVLWKESA